MIVFLVLIEGDHLIEHLFGHLVYRCQLEWCDGYLYIAQSSDDRLNFRIFDAVQRLYHHQVVLLLGVLHDGRFNRCEVLLV
jgi:hypothetical protein